jgi:hypothetical protein
MGTIRHDTVAAEDWEVRLSLGEAENALALVRFRRGDHAFVVWWIQPKVEGVDEAWAREVASTVEALLRDRWAQPSGP